jgi:REase associating with pPIWI_RE
MAMDHHPGLIEVALYQALADRGLKPVLWPDLDAYDLHVEAGKEVFQLDLKDYTNPMLLARKVQADEGDAGGAQWLVVPDYRASSVPLLTTVCREFGLKVTTAGEIGAKICQAGAWRGREATAPQKRGSDPGGPGPGRALLSPAGRGRHPGRVVRTCVVPARRPLRHVAGVARWASRKSSGSRPPVGQRHPA